MPIIEDLVAVVNENDEPYTDTFDGEEYTFEPDKESIIPVGAARHIFGYDTDQTRKLSRLVRMGATILTDEEMLEAKESKAAESIKRKQKLDKSWQWLGNFKFYPVRTKVERAADEYVVVKPEEEVAELPAEETIVVEKQTRKPAVADKKRSKR